ncbi:DUF2141 domain-containing protein [Gloeocapsa sp. PCC 73106]|uniref:DUF2141 domain-containing protein n=1 Tax=Gloeocapsa sp. PCC 73106 TaxID=102232 RepID=UPI0002AC582A|nr:DUF2141 domain-containing protein [Gloeocapsa sp. PCC 73106]ELR99500.1 hypothetical protein GLO73106DRAFT_00033520 [Gloeocapsa sp. PCC 73106]
MSETSTLTIQVSGLRNANGNLCVALFNSPDGYPSNITEAIRLSSVLIETTPQVILFEELAYGTYAIVAFHDENGDSKLNTNFLGIPKEGIGFSGDPKIWRGVPAYEKVKFEFTPEEKTIGITMKYLL